MQPTVAGSCIPEANVSPPEAAARWPTNQQQPRITRERAKASPKRGHGHVVDGPHAQAAVAGGPGPAQLLRRLADRLQRAARPLGGRPGAASRGGPSAASSAPVAHCARARPSRAAPLPGVSGGRWWTASVQHSARSGHTAPRQDGRCGPVARETAAGAAQGALRQRAQDTEKDQRGRGCGEQARVRQPHLRRPDQLRAPGDAAPC